MTSVYINMMNVHDLTDGLRGVIYCGSRHIVLEDRTIFLDAVIQIDWYKGYGWIDNGILFVYLPDVNVLENPPIPGTYHPSVLDTEIVAALYADELQTAVERAVFQMTQGFPVGDEV